MEYPTNFSELLLRELHNYYLPVGLLSSLGLIMLPSTRILGLSSFPMVFFLTLIINQKKPYYIVPEWLLFHLFIFSAAAFIFSKATKKVEFNFTGQILLVILAFMITMRGALLSPDFMEIKKTDAVKQIHPIDIARNCAQSIVGNNALMGTGPAIWYVSGATYWYHELKDLLSKDENELNNYLDGADYFADYPFEDNGRSSIIPLSDLYTCGQIHLSGMVFNHPDSYVIYSGKQKTELPSVYSFDMDSVKRYSISKEGDYVFGALFCSADSQLLQPFQYPVEYMAFLNKQKPCEKQVIFFLAPAGDFIELEKKLAGTCHRNEFYFAERRSYTYSEFMKAFPQYDTMEYCYVNQQEAKRR